MKLLNTRMPILLVVLVVILFASTAWVGVAQAQPKNIIFFIGDGMGPEQVKAARYYAGSPLSFESFPYQGEITTHNAGGGVTDSAAAGTALATGVKVNNGVISIADPGDGSELETLLEYFKAQGKRTGLVTTTYMAHATPATFGAHEPSRSNYGPIVNDYLTQTQPNVLFGARRYITADDAIAAGYTVKTFWDVGRDNIPDDDGLKWLDTETATIVSGQFYGGPENDYHIPYEDDGVGDLPHLSEMTDVALRILDNDPDGFFLMVEGGRIDHACHAWNIHKAILETLEFDNAVQEASTWAAGRTDTLILVTADHETGGLTVVYDNGPGNDPTVTWSTDWHTGVDVPVYAWGVNSEMIYGTMDNTDMFAVCTDCFPSDHPDHAQWLLVGKPYCWCYPRQCHGDACNDAQGRYNYWVGTNDLAVFVAAWNKPFADIEGLDVNGTPLICSDCDHLPEGRYSYRVSARDLNIFVANWNIPNGPDPDCFAGYKSLDKEYSIEEIIIWLAELWLTDEEVRKTIDEDDWQKFIESVSESM